MMPDYWPQAVRELSRCDAALAQLVERYAGATLVSRGAPFSTLVRSIVGQQISVKAADRVWARVSAALPELVPDAVLTLSVEELRACGLSARKVEYISDLARHFSSGQIHVNRWNAMSDVEIIAELTAVRGIGVWTAEMFLIFNQLRPDVYPLDDIGLQRAVALHYFGGERLADAAGNDPRRMNPFAAQSLDDLLAERKTWQGRLYSAK